jgi:RNA polymerase sigma-70 factor (ECF subfamily)
VEDELIIEMYFKRDELAITETDRKYGAFCHRVAMNILSIREDAEECVNDTYHAAWRQIPPTFPDSLRAFLGRITRNLSVSRFRANRAEKRYTGMEQMLSELNDCVPSSDNVKQAIETE